jgi:hypothetical protein
MTALRATGPVWTTVSLGGATNTSAVDLSALGDHLSVCKRLCGRLFAIQCIADLMRGFVVSRFVTTMAALTLLIGAALLLL